MSQADAGEHLGLLRILSVELGIATAARNVHEIDDLSHRNPQINELWRATNLSFTIVPVTYTPILWLTKPKASIRNLISECFAANIVALTIIPMRYVKQTIDLTVCPVSDKQERLIRLGDRHATSLQQREVLHYQPYRRP